MRGSTNHLLKGKLRIFEAWGLSIQKSSSLYKKLKEANFNGLLKEQLGAWDDRQLVEDAREISAIEAGFGPSWPSRTKLGLKYRGNARDEGNKLIVNFNSKN